MNPQIKELIGKVISRPFIKSIHQNLFKFLFFIGIIILLLLKNTQWLLFFLPFFIPIVYIINILQNLDKLNLFDSNYFLSYTLYSPWGLIFLIIGATYFSLVLNLIISNKSNNKVKKILLSLLFTFLLLSLIFIGISKYNYASGRILYPEELSIIFISIVILTRINQNPIKYYSTKYKFLFLFLAWILVMMIISEINTRFNDWSYLLRPIVMPIAYTINILSNVNKSNLFASNHFWGLNIGSQFWSDAFLILGATYFSLISTLLSGKNERVKKGILWVLFIFFLLSLISRSYYDYYLELGSSSGFTTMGGTWYIHLGEFSVIVTCGFILNYIVKFDLKFIFTTSIKYIHTILELLLIYFFGLIFLNINLAPDATTIDRWYFRIFIFVVTLFFFLILELSQDWLENLFNEKLNRFSLWRSYFLKLFNNLLKK